MTMRDGMQLFGLGLTALATLAGCKGESDPEKPGNPLAVVAQAASEPKGSKPAGVSFPKEEFNRLHQPFKTAVLLDPPDGELRPPDQTSAGKNVARLFEAIVGKDMTGGLWDEVRFVSPAGKLIHYRAVVKTELGEIEIEFLPEAAPNHVRSFIALARAGYFDGLPFYRSINQTSDDGAVAFVESGCPKGTGEFGYGSIGYWLKPEISPKATHEPGAVGASHREELETAACRFYIAAQRMPQIDGAFTVFGKVVRGLDVVRTMNERPVQTASPDLLQQPVAIQSVVIHQRDDAN